MIIRPDYIRAVTPFINVPLVKSLAGVRRSGKSTIFDMLKEELISRGISKEQIISRKYTEMDADSGFDAKAVYQELKDRIAGQQKFYLFLDELQEIDGWEKVVNNLLEDENVDIYVTGSNSKLMSGEIETYLSGRYVSIPVFTLSFKEYLSFKGKNETEARKEFNDYLQFGGFPI